MARSSFGRVLWNRGWWLSAGLLLVAAVACGGGSSKGGSSGTGGMGGDSGTGGSKNGSDGDDNGNTGGTGGTDNMGGSNTGGGSNEVMAPTPGLGLVPGGVRAESANFIAIFTLGYAPDGNRVMQSDRYRMDAGLVGAMQRD